MVERLGRLSSIVPPGLGAKVAPSVAIAFLLLPGKFESDAVCSRRGPGLGRFPKADKDTDVFSEGKGLEADAFEGAGDFENLRNMGAGRGRWLGMETQNGQRDKGWLYVADCLFWAASHRGTRHDFDILKVKISTKRLLYRPHQAPSAKRKQIATRVARRLVRYRGRGPAVERVASEKARTGDMESPGGIWFRSSHIICDDSAGVHSCGTHLGVYASRIRSFPGRKEMKTFRSSTSLPMAR